MTDPGRRNPPLHLTGEVCPRKPRFLTSAPQRPVPELGHMVDEAVQARTVERHPVVLIVPPQHRAHPFALFPQVSMHALPEFLLQLSQLRLHPLPHRLAKHREPPPSRLPADVREPKKVERLRFAFAPPLPVTRRMSSKLDQSSLFSMQ